MLIADIVDAKGRGVVTVPPGTTVGEAVSALAAHRIGALVVSEDGVHVDGIVSERDVVRQLDREHEGLLSRTVHEIMSNPVHTCGRDDEVSRVMQTMTDERIRHVPVVEDGELVGLVSIGDVVKATIEKLELDRKLLEEYITAR